VIALRTIYSILLQPQTAMIFEVRGVSRRAGAVSEHWVCRALIGQEKETIELYHTQIVANFVDPLLQFSVDKLYFEQLNVPGQVIKPQSQPISFTNISALPLHVNLRVPVSIDLRLWLASVLKKIRRLVLIPLRVLIGIVCD
jgi:hypothetical protein